MSANKVPPKQPLKIIEVPLNKFSDEAIPHYQKLLALQKQQIQKLIVENNVEQLQREIKANKRVIRQLKDLSYELDTLRAQVEDCDLDKFDMKTLSLRKIILSLISEYGILEKLSYQVLTAHQEKIDIECSQNPFDGASQIQIQDNIDDLKIRERENTLQRVETLHGEIQDLHEMYVDLNQMVGVQHEHVEVVEKNVEETSENVNRGLRELMKAHKLKAATYPVTGAVLGSILGGPVGMFAGIKIGSIVAIGCGVIGYTSGKLFNKFSTASSGENCENNLTSLPNEPETDKTESNVSGKKDI